VKVVVVGQGYVGLPLAVAGAEAGFDVTGFDSDPARVAMLNEGRSPIDDVADDALAAVVQAGRFRASTDPACMRDASTIVICVPTPYHADAPDLSFIEAAARDVAANLTPGAIVILESTTYPGTTEEVLLPILEAGSGLAAGTDFDVAFSPERIDPGNERFGIRNTPKIVGALTERGTELAATFYGSFVDRVVRVSGPRSAEMAKLLENTFRHINIALVNELAIVARELDVDIWEVIDAAATKPFGFMPFYPGPGVGGHCIPVDPMYLSWRVKQLGGAAKFIDLARDVNDAMPAYCLSRVQDLLNDIERPLKRSRIVVLGVAYKANISDMRESPALPLIEGLRARGADVVFHDPHVESVRLADGAVLERSALTDDLLRSAACVIVVTGHDAIDYEHVAATAPLVFDTRNTPGLRGPNVHRL
jgi:UDP-N-acetyl-D-glucosamine dehydrogenase